MKTSSAKAKGRRAAQELKDLMLKVAPYLKEEDIVLTSSGDTGEDLKLGSGPRSVFPFSPEVKNQETAKVWEWIKQAEGHHPKYPGVVFFRRNRSKMYALLDCEEFLRICERASGVQEEE